MTDGKRVLGLGGFSVVELGNTAGMLLFSPLDFIDHALKPDLTYCNLGTNTCKIASINHQCVPSRFGSSHGHNDVSMQNCRISSPGYAK